MRLFKILPYAALIVLGEAAIGSVPDIVAVREGGMGLGSALLMAQLAQVAGTAFGATLAAYLVDRGSPHVALVGGALLYYAGLIGVGHQPSHLLGWVIVIMALAGAGLGMMLAAAFSTAAGERARTRPLAISLLLLAALVASPLVGNVVFRPGPAALVVVAAIVVAVAVLLAWNDRARERTAGRFGEQGQMTARVPLVGGGLFAAGVLAMLWGIDPSRVSAAMVAGTLGVGGLESLDGLRIALVLIGVVAVAAGVVVLYLGRRPSRGTVLAAVGSAAAALAVAGLLAVAGFAMPRELSPPDSRGGPLGELSALAGGVAGLLLGAWLLARDVRPRVVASSGGLVLAGLAVLVVGGAGSALGSSGAIGPIATIVAVGFAGALIAVALRLALADAPIGERGFAAAAGVASVALGAIAGLMIGAAQGVALAIGTAEGVPVGSLILAAAALVSLGVAAVLPHRAPAERVTV